MNSKFLFSLILASLSFVGALQAQFTATYNFAGVTTSSGVTDPTAVPVATGVTFGSFTAVGTPANPSATGRFSFTDWATGGAAGSGLYSEQTGSVNPAEYYEVTITPQAGYKLDLTSLAFKIERSSTGVRTLAVRSDAGGDSFSTNLVLAGTNAGLAVEAGNELFLTVDSETIRTANAFNLTGPSFQNLSSPVTFRFYGWNAEGATGTFSINQVVVVGSATALIAPTINGQPVSQSVVAGTTVTFNVAAAGTPAPTYQWSKDGVAINNATAASLVLNAVSTGASGSYTVAVTNSAGTVTSSAAVLTVNAAPAAPTINGQPASQGVVAGTTVTFNVAAAGTPAPTYQWSKDGVAINNATAASLVLNAVSTGASGSYTVAVTNSAGTVTSSAAVLTVNAAPAAPTINGQPASQSVVTGTTVTFNVAAAGMPAPTYQWSKDGVAINNATAASLVLNAVSTGASGSYTVAVTNSAGTVTSSAAVLTVNAAPAAPTINGQPASQSVVAGTTVTFNVAAAGTPAPTYQWSKDGVAINNATAASLVLSTVSTGAGGSYTVAVTNSAGTVTSSAAVLTVNVAPAAPTINGQPASQSVVTGTTVTFNVAAAGTPAPTYQWSKDGVAINNATTASLVLNAVSTGASGSYTVAVTNSAGTVTSSAAVLTVNAAPATAAFGNLAATYDGTAKSATVTTTPSGLTTSIVYTNPSGGSLAGAPTDAGSYQVTATITSANYAGSATGTLVIAKAAQTITFAALPTQVNVGTPYTLSATASSGLPVTYKIESGNATLANATLTLNDTGAVVVRATQAGDANRNAATADLTVSAAQQTQTITFAALAERSATAAPQTLSAVASSGLPVTFSVVSGPATITGTTLTLTGAGTVTVRAAQAGNAAFSPATAVDQSFTVAPVAATVALGNLTATYDGTGKSVTVATTPAGLATSIGYLTNAGVESPNAPIDAGSYEVGAKITDPKYTGKATGTLVIAKAAQTITFAPLPTQVNVGTPYTLSATASSGLPVTYKIESGNATLANATLTLNDTSTVVVRATQAGDANRNAATVDLTLTAAQQTQTITFAALAERSATAAPQTLSAVASSGLPVTFSVVSGPATITGTTLTLTGAGTVTVRAAQAGNAAFSPATAVDQSFTVAPVAATVALGNLTATYDGTGKSVTVATTPAGLATSIGYLTNAGVESPNAPIDAGSYEVGAKITDPKYTGKATGTLVIAKAAQTITFAPLPTQVNVGTPYTLSATASSGLPVTYKIESGNATLANATLTLNDTSTVVVRATQAGDANRNAATADLTVSAAQQTQTITFAALAERSATAAPQTLSAVASSGLPVTFSVVSGPATITGTTLTLTGAGTVTVRAAQAGNAAFSPATAVDQSFTVAPVAATVALGNLTATYDGTGKSVTVATTPAGLATSIGYLTNAGVESPNAPIDAGSYEVGAKITDPKYTGKATGTLVIAKAAQTITFAPLPTQVNVGTPYTLSATASSGLPVTYKIESGNATLANATLTLNDTSTVVVRATQAGDANRNAATVDLTLTAAQQTQTITFAALAERSATAAPQTLSAVASSGLPVTFSVVSGPATITGTTLTLTGAGTVTVRAAQAGNAAFSPATAVDQSFTVAPVAATVALGNLTATYDGTGKSVTVATTPAGLATSIGYLTNAGVESPNAPIDAGSYEVGAKITDPKYTGKATGTLVIAKAAQTITFAPLPTQVNVGTPYTLSATASSGLPVTYKIESGNATLANATLTLNDTSTVVVRATQAGDANRNAATADLTVSAAQQTQTITFAALAERSATAAPQTLSAVASSGLPVTFSVVSGPATITGTTLTLAGTPGTVTVRATQAGNAAFSPAPAVDRVLLVVSSSPVIVSPPVSLTLLAGSTASFSVVASGTPPLAYAWSKDGVLLPGFTGPAITINRATALSAGNYTVVVSNAAGSSPTSLPATLVVNTPPTITTPPLGQTVTAGANVTLSAAASGSGTLVFQWSKDGLNLGSPSANLVLPSVAVTDSGNYAVTVTSVFGSVTSNPALLTVEAAQVAPSITTQPVPISVVTGSTATFTVAAAGSAPFTFQWRKDGIILAGAVAATLTVPNTREAAAGNYSVLVSNKVATVASDNAALTVTAPVLPPVITSPSAAPIGLNGPFAYLITATNAPTAFNATGLPAGLSVNTVTGVISGTPTAAGSATVTLTASNSAGAGTLALTLNVAQPVPVISSAAVVTGRAGVVFGGYAATATNTPTAFAVASGLLPAGLTLNPANGQIAGTPTASGTFDVTLTATNGGGTSPPFPVSFRIAAAATVPVITSSPVATGRVGDPFSYQTTASFTPLSFAAVGPLPAGLSINATGLVAGSPTTAGRFSLSLTATNADGTSAPLVVQITITPSALSPIITSSTTAGGTAGSAFSYTIAASNTPIAFSANGLPSGLSVNGTTGAITGVAAVPGEFTVVLGASNASGAAAPKTLSLKIAPGLAAPAITSSSAATGRVGVAFAYPALATNSPTAFTATGLPAGLAMDPLSGVISGVPTAAGQFAVKLTAANAGGPGASFTLALTIDAAAAAPAITSAVSAAASSGALFTYQMIATNGPILSFAATDLPAGLAINPASGLITGTPTVAGLFRIPLAARNAAGSSAPLTLLLNVKPSALSPVVTSASTALGTQGSIFTYTITASNMPATTPLPVGNGYTVAGLPDGLALNAATGVITGTPSTTGTFIVLLTATNDAGGSAPRSLAITVRASLAAPEITSSNTAAATSNVPFGYQIRGTNAPTSYDATDRPAWLSIDTTTGALSGTPPRPGQFFATLSATNAAGTGLPLLLTISATPASGSPIITSSGSAQGRAGAAFSLALAATNSPLSFVAAGLPAGLSLAPATGIISGVPAAPGVFRVEVSAVNAVGVGGARVLTLNFSAAPGTPVIGLGAGDGPDGGPQRMAAAAVAYDYAEFRSLADGDARLISAGSREIAAAAGLTSTGVVGEAFSYQIPAGGTPTAYLATGLPTGLALNPTTGMITGVPLAAGVFDAEIGASNDLGAGASVPFTLTIRAPASAPAVTSASTAAGTVGTAFTYQIAATNSPVSYNVTDLPSGLALNSTSGAITGTPFAPGVFKVKVSANNATGSGSETEVSMTLAAAAGAPVVSSSATASGSSGAVFTYQAAATGSVAAWNASNLPAGLDIDVLTGLVSGTPAVDGIFNATLTARNATGVSAPYALRLTVAPSLATSAVTSATTANITPGAAFTYQIAAGNSPVSYNASDLPAGLTLNAATGLISGTVRVPGTYLIAVSANNASGPGPVTTLTVAVAGADFTAPTNLTSIATRARVGTGANVLIAGFAIAGTEPKAVLIRAVGPTLGGFGLTGVLVDPVLELFRNDGSTLAVNDSWGLDGNAAAITATSARVGAFALPSGSTEAVISVALPPGNYTAQVRGAAGGTGIGLVEVYDAGTGTENSRLSSISSRAEVGVGGNILIAGFVVRGTEPRTILIRGVGPGLNAFVTGAVANPKLELYRSATLINENDDWTDPAIAAAAARSGTFAITVGSRDAALLVTLPPGSYTAQVSGVAASTGVALIEVYEAP